nr:lysoplasmalogenase family protein [Blautia coccoides]
MRGWDMLLLPATAALIVFLGTAYVRKKHETGRKEIGYKVSATLMAVIPALCLAVREQNRVSWLIAAGTVCCMAADGFLEVCFVAGAAVFAAAHLCFIGGMLCLASPDRFTLLLFVCVYAVLFAILRSYIRELGKLAALGALYVAFLCAMFSMAGTVFFENPGLAGAAAALGGAAFVASDTILAVNLLGEKNSRRLDKILLVLYYGAVYLLAVCRYLPG